MKKILLFLIALNFFKNTDANVLIVNNNADAPQGHFTDLQPAFDAANTGDTVYILGSSNSFGGFFYVNKRLVILGPGYNPRKDVPAVAFINGFLTLNFGSEHTIIRGLNLFTLTIYASYVEVSDCRFSYNGISTLPVTGLKFYNNIFETSDNRFLSGIGGSIGNSYFLNNIFINNDNVPLTPTCISSSDGNIIKNNLFAGRSPGNLIYTFTTLSTALVSNNIFYGCAPASPPGGLRIKYSDFAKNISYLTDHDSIPPDNYEIDTNFISQNPLFVDYIPLNINTVDFSLNYHLQNSSPGYKAGTDSTDIGPYGGEYPFGEFAGWAKIPQVTELNILNSIIGQEDSIQLHIKAIANTNSPIISAEYFIDTDYLSGNNIPINIISGDSLNFYINLPNGLSLGNHILGFRFKNANGVWSFPEIRSFTVCDISGPISEFNLYTYGNDIICENLSKNNIDRYHWYFGDGDTSNLENPIHHYKIAGIYEVKLTTYNSCNSEGNVAVEKAIIKGVNSISPDNGGNIGIITMTITGGGFTSNTKVKLTKEGQSDVFPLDSTTVITNESVQIKTAFNLKDIVIGKWNVVIEVPGDTTFFIPDGFTIDTGKFPEPFVQLIGPSFIPFHNLTGEVYTLQVSNKGNTDALGVPVWIAVPQTMDIEINFPLDHPNSLNYVVWDTIPEILTIDTLFGKYYNYKLFGFVVQNIPGNTTQSFSINLTPQERNNFEILYWVSRPMYSSDSTLVTSRGTDVNNCFFDKKKANCIIDLASTF